MTVYRIDRFTLPASARDEFLAAVEHTHLLLREQPGFEHDLLVESPLPSDQLALLTLAAWTDDAAVAGARAAVLADRATSGFDPAALMARLGVEPEMAEYRPVS